MASERQAMLNALFESAGGTRQGMLALVNDYLAAKAPATTVPLTESALLRLAGHYGHRDEGSVIDSVLSLAGDDDDRADQQQTIIVVPSLTLDAEELKLLTGVLHYEERQLFHLLRLRDPRVRVIYCSSKPIHEAIVTYFLSLACPGNVESARERLTMMAMYDSRVEHALADKILQRPRTLARLRKMIAADGSSAEHTVMECFIPTRAEWKLAGELNVPLVATPPDLQWLGSKAGSRQAFREAGVPLPAGTETSLFTPRDVAAAVVEHAAARGKAGERLVVKLNESFSGKGNAVLDVRALAKPLTADSVLAAMDAMRFQDEHGARERYYAGIAELGAIFEEFVVAEGLTSPSAQGFIHSDGRCEILSTHEQILGGPDKQVYLGCRFPAADEYRALLCEYTQAIGDVIAAKGARGRFGVDYVTWRDAASGEWQARAIEINLRTCGTTHPFETMRALVGGGVSADHTGCNYVAADGRRRFYMATDNLHKPQYEGLLPSDFVDIVSAAEVGVLAIGTTRDEADALYARCEAVLDAATVK